MAKRGMGAATKGGGAVGMGPANKVLSTTSKMVDPVMMAKGGMATKGYAAGGMATKGYAAGGMATKGYAAGGAAMKSKGSTAGGAMKKKAKAK
jgi:hypothetical protein